MGPELVWKAVLEWPVIVLCTVIAFHWLFRLKRPSSAFGGGIGSRFVPIVAVLLPVAVSEAVQEAVTVRELLAHLPTTVSYGALPWAMLAAVAAAIFMGNGSGALGRVVGAVLVPAVAFVFLSPPGLGGGEPQLVALSIAALAGFAACGVSGRPGPAPLLGWWLVLAVASVMVLLSGFAKLAVVLGAVSAMAATLAVCTVTTGRPVMGNGLSVTLVTALAACAFLGCGYDETGFPRWTWALLAAAPAATALASVRAVDSRPRLRTAVIFLGPAAVAALALAAAMFATASTASTTDSAADPYASAPHP